LNAKNIVDLSKKHFGCNNLDAIPMENDQNDGGSHFERITFGNEIMTATELDGTVISQFTLAVYEASGWYLPDFT
jgi:hypothetical protein